MSPVTGTVDATLDVSGAFGVLGTAALVAATAAEGALGKFALALLSTLTSTP
jgi:hypothetical protein